MRRGYTGFRLLANNGHEAQTNEPNAASTLFLLASWLAITVGYDVGVCVYAVPAAKVLCLQGFLVAHCSRGAKAQTTMRWGPFNNLNGSRRSLSLKVVEQQPIYRGQREPLSAKVFILVSHFRGRRRSAGNCRRRR